MILSHTIALDPTVAQEIYFSRACGVARFAWNWGLAEWQRMHAAGEKPTANKIKAKWNEHRKSLPWTYDVTKCASGQSIIDLGVAFNNFFRDLKKTTCSQRSRYPRFKLKKRNGGFALWNDQFDVDGRNIRIPRLGWVRMRETLRFGGKIMGARVIRVGCRWVASIHVDVDASIMRHTKASVVGIDLGVSTLLTLSKPLPDGRTEIANPKARRTLMKRQRKLQRRMSRQELCRRKTSGKISNRQIASTERLRKIHYRIASIRSDAINKATTLVARNFSTIIIENLNVSGMTKNHSLAGAVLDASFGNIRKKIEQKAAMRGGDVLIANRWFPSSKMCSCCGYVIATLPLSRREWECSKCGAHHLRDHNAAKNLEKLVVGPAWAEPSACNPQATCGDIEALVAKQLVTKLWCVNRKLNQTSSDDIQNIDN